MEPPSPQQPPLYGPSEPQATPTFIGVPMNSAASIQYSSHHNHLPTPASGGRSPRDGHGPRQPWTTGLYHCCKDPKSCCLTCWCPCIAFGRIAEIVDRGSISCGVSGSLYALMAWALGCSCMYSCLYRTKLRAQYSLEKKPCEDCCVHCWCEFCSLCQEYRELQNRGFDMSIGWHGNMERQRRLEEMRPPVVPSVMQP